LEASDNPLGDTSSRRRFSPFLRVVANDSKQGPEDARYIIQHLHPKAVMLVDDREAYSTRLAHSMIPVLRQARIRVDHESVGQA
jgi:ABC-type branched-subunit amino acid transport system substrate-binding protein